jgi:hypothetical protein
VFEYIDTKLTLKTTPTENSQLEGLRWQSHHQARVLWANNPHILNQTIKETSTKKNQADSRSTTFGINRKMKIGIWNVRTLRETGKLRQAEACMRNYGLNILGMSEVRWREFGEMTTHDGATFIYSGRPQDDNTSREGVGILMDKEAKRSLIEWHPVSARLIVARFKTTIRNIVMIQCYAPTAAAEEAERQEFYMQLNEILRRKKKRDIIILGRPYSAQFVPILYGSNEVVEHEIRIVCGILNERTAL